MADKNHWILLGAIILLIGGCNNEIDLVRQSDPQPIVYCVFNPMDTVYYVSLTKSFQGDANAYDLAKQPGSVFYDSADIRLMGLGSDETVLFETEFVPCDQTKNPGIFPETGGYLYRSTKEIDLFRYFHLYGKYAGITHFRLEVRIPGYGPLIESTIPRIDPTGIVVPMFDSTKFDFYSRTPPRFVLRSEVKDYSDAIDFVVRFRYWDWYPDSIKVFRVVDLLIRQDLAHRQVVAFDFSPELFLNQLDRNIPDDDQVKEREFVNFDFICFNANNAVKMYVDTWELATSDYHMVDFTNFTNARGLFSMKNAWIRYNNTFHHGTLDTIAFSPVTAHLKFKGSGY